MKTNNQNNKIKHQIHSGVVNESKFVNVIKHYTDTIYRNKRLRTCLTGSGTTEIDILFAYQDTIFIIEAKNIIALEGKLYQRNWRYKAKTIEFIALNPIVQNKIHVRAFKNNFFKMYGYYPQVQSFVVVPNHSVFDDTLTSEILTLSDFDNYLFHYQNVNHKNKYLQYQLKRMF